MITRRKLLMGLAAGVAAATAAATLIRVATPINGTRPHAKQWYPTAYHNVMVSDPNSSWRKRPWRKTKYPGNYDESTMSADKEWYGRQNGRPRT